MISCATWFSPLPIFSALANDLRYSWVCGIGLGPSRFDGSGFERSVLPFQRGDGVRERSAATIAHPGAREGRRGSHHYSLGCLVPGLPGVGCTLCWLALRKTPSLCIAETCYKSFPKFFEHLLNQHLYQTSDTALIHDCATS